MLRLIIASLLLVPLPAIAATQDAVVAEDEQAARRAGGVKLARLIYSAERQKNLATGSMLDQLAGFFRADPNFQALEAQAPGAVDAVVDAIRPELLAFTLRELPRYHHEVGRIYARHMTVTELEEAYAFYSSPLGTRLVDETQGNIDFSTVFGDIAYDPDGKTSEESLSKDQQRAVAKTVGNLSAEELEPMIAVSRQSWFKKIQLVQPDIMAYDAAYMNSPSPEYEARIEKVVTEALEAHMAAAASD